MNDYGRALRRWRRLRGVKQSHAAELFGVTQATLSRWESGRHRLPEQAIGRLSRLLAAPLDSPGDAALRRLVESSGLAVHLICDLEHGPVIMQEFQLVNTASGSAQSPHVSPTNWPAAGHRC